MRKAFVAGNWKMHTTSDEAVALGQAILRGAPSAGVDIAVCPPSVYLQAVATALAGSDVALGAQNMYFEERGAFTGEVSPLMLKDVGCTCVILGHSERRHVFGESDDLVGRKVKSALGLSLKPILCVGEKLDEREAGRTREVVERQVRAGLADVAAESVRDLTIAYEPVWAIGTGRNATPDQAQEVHEAIRTLLARLYGDDIAQVMRIQYGGSVKPENAKEIFDRPDIDGGLIGGASLKAGSFLAIVHAAL